MSPFEAQALKQKSLIAERLRSLVIYEPATGYFFRKHKPDVRGGRLHHSGYRWMRVDGIEFPEHRLAWLYVNGEWPSNFIDHINCVRDDNRFDNLREATIRENAQNALPHKTCAVKGVDRVGRRWRAKIHYNGRSHHIGCFDTPEEAGAAYSQKASEVFGEFARASR